MYLTSAALTNLQSCLLQSASSYIASKVSVITSLTLGVVPMPLLGWKQYYAQGSLSGPLVSQLLRKSLLSKHGVPAQNTREKAVHAAVMKGCAGK